MNLHSNNGQKKPETLNRVPSRSSIGKTQLPALNSHILIITSNSSKGLVHNNWSIHLFVSAIEFDEFLLLYYLILIGNERGIWVDTGCELRQAQKNQKARSQYLYSHLGKEAPKVEQEPKVKAVDHEKRYIQLLKRATELLNKNNPELGTHVFR